jgi:hypothetical protein
MGGLATGPLLLIFAILSVLKDGLLKMLQMAKALSGVPKC